ncbi:UDP-N-acetylmuramate--L-alanine ligase [Limihaloglobus sulfuriphilus]|uniref:UDP-N-acetylmuramate--L-alanine ligase n=1 Tax=Limihaloglobus sulfuriphilus TaxID=1851148 RepID=A0A1Q2MG29_9BACT|nr:UDP-N-acetylmuramate--L-alanine ligase [Limihaloglobus sulfuriphilus]AQQ71222.1 UDP-N-acetylmuramate--L-alanine ligase [Limihaloglobus sulfuriphilus]
MFRDKKYHFIGIGGIGMSGLARILLKFGAVITGSDMGEGIVLKNLRDLGINVKTGHMKEYLSAIPGGVDAVVISAAIPEANPELAYARQAGLKVVRYAEMLGIVMSLYRGVAIAGTHGKSTTSGWAAFVLDRLGMCPNYVVGADVNDLAASSGVGSGEFFVAEACEYARSFLNLHPTVSTVLNVEEDHLDYYRDLDDIIDAFGSFMRGTRTGGKIILNADDVNYQRLRDDYESKKDQYRSHQIYTFGMNNPQADYRAQNAVLTSGGGYQFDILFAGRRLGSASLKVPGVHNVYNALAVTASLSAAGVGMDKILSVIGDFSGVDRRMTLLKSGKGIRVYDDYAHHPTEIKATLSAMRQMCQFEGCNRLICIFQPHQYSRTRFLIDDFASSFDEADLVIVPEIYFVRDSEDSLQNVNSQMLVDKINNRCEKLSGRNHQKSEPRALFIETREGIISEIKNNATSGDVIITMGAGDIWKVADAIVQWLR